MEDEPRTSVCNCSEEESENQSCEAFFSELSLALSDIIWLYGHIEPGDIAKLVAYAKKMPDYEREDMRGTIGDASLALVSLNPIFRALGFGHHANLH